MRKLFLLFFLTVLFSIILLLTSCSFVYVKQLSAVPKIYEKMTVFGISHIQNLKPEGMRLAEGASSIDAKAIASSLISGTYFKYNRSNEDSPFDSAGYRQVSWAELHNFEVIHRDLLKCDKNDFIVTQAHINLLYDMDERNYRTLQSGVPYETRVKIKAEDLISINQVVSIGIRQVVEDVYKDKTEMVDGTAWIISVKPSLKVSGVLSNDMNRYLETSGSLVPESSSDSIVFNIQLVLKEGYVPEDTSRISGGTGRLTDISDFVIGRESIENEYVAPGFAIATTSEDREEAKTKAKERALEFLKFTTQGFEFNREIGIRPRADRQEIKNPDYEFVAERLPSTLGVFYVGRGTGMIQPFDKPVVPPAGYKITQVFPMNNLEWLDEIFEKLPLILANIARQRNGRISGMGYFGRNFHWRVFLDEKEGFFKFQITCNVYIHSTITPK